MRKCESLLYKINTCLEKTTTCIGLRTGNILNKYIKYIFPILGVAFKVPILCYFQKLQLLVVKKNLNQLLLHSTSTFMSSKSLSQTFKILFETGDVNVFVLRGVIFSTYVQLKSYISSEKNISGEIRDTV